MRTMYARLTHLQTQTDIDRHRQTDKQRDRQTQDLTELRFYIPLDTKQVISKMLFPANLLTSTEKTKLKIRRNNYKKHTINLG